MTLPHDTYSETANLSVLAYRMAQLEEVVKALKISVETYASTSYQERSDMAERLTRLEERQAMLLRLLLPAGAGATGAVGMGIYHFF